MDIPGMSTEHLCEDVKQRIEIVGCRCRQTEPRKLRMKGDVCTKRIGMERSEIGGRLPKSFGTLGIVKTIWIQVLRSRLLIL